MTTYVSIAAIANGTIIYANPANLYSAGNPGGTQVWGNGDASDGAPPGIPGDVIDAGTVIVLNNSVTPRIPPR